MTIQGIGLKRPDALSNQTHLDKLEILDRSVIDLDDPEKYKANNPNNVNLKYIPYQKCLPMTSRES